METIRIICAALAPGRAGLDRIERVALILVLCALATGAAGGAIALFLALEPGS